MATASGPGCANFITTSGRLDGVSEAGANTHPLDCVLSSSCYARKGCNLLFSNANRICSSQNGTKLEVCVL